MPWASLGELRFLGEELQFNTSMSGLMLTFVANVANIKDALGEVTATALETPVETASTPVETVSTPVEMLRYWLLNPSMSVAEVATALGKSRRAVERATAKLVKDGLLRRMGSKKGGRWEVL